MQNNCLNYDWIIVLVLITAVITIFVTSRVLICKKNSQIFSVKYAINSWQYVQSGFNIKVKRKHGKVGN